jgi:hypothetical protein
MVQFLFRPSALIGGAARGRRHMFKLLTRDAHKRILPVAQKLRKEKRRADVSPRGGAGTKRNPTWCFAHFSSKLDQ